MKPLELENQLKYLKFQKRYASHFIMEKDLKKSDLGKLKYGFKQWERTKNHVIQSQAEEDD